MEAKEKAKVLVNEFYKCMPFKDVKLTSCDENPYLIVEMEELSAKQCALVMVTEIMEECLDVGSSQRYNYWQKVKTEIEKL